MFAALRLSPWDHQKELIVGFASRIMGNIEGPY